MPENQSKIIWDSISEREESLKRFLNDNIEKHDRQLNGAHERLLKMCIHVNTLFLTGWIALLSVDKLDHQSQCLFKVLLWTSCGLHVLTFALLTLVEWKIMRLHFNTQKRAIDIFPSISTSSEKKRSLLTPHLSKGESIPEEIWNQVIAADKETVEQIKKSISAHDSQNKTVWKIAKFAIFTFFFSILTSTISLITLLIP